ncbi:MAG TPA: class I SAM-dependent methyltransferase [Anaerolineaceae bacterium]|nr:class I SAM-dependent methyltransferase [Anaerolineaceae bacterium]
MIAQHLEQPEYGNWVPVKMIIVPAVLGIACLALVGLHWAFLIPSVLFLAIAAYFGISRYLFSTRGGKVQDRVQDLVVSHIDWPGRSRVLDIGCGNGPLAIKIAHGFPGAEVVGLDYWGKNWDYSMQICEENARRAGVAGRVSFKHGSASALPFDNGRFDLVVSNLTFHEVADEPDKRKCIQEALRVLKPGGTFVLQDLFLLRSVYGAPEELVGAIRGWGVREVELIRTCDEPFIPAWVKLPFMVGTLAILRGKK